MARLKKVVLSLLLLSLPLSAAGVVVGSRAQASSPPPQVLLSSNAKLGKFLVSASHLTLYHLVEENTEEDNGKFACTGQCLSFWPPLLLPKSVAKPSGGVGVSGRLGVVSRKGIGNQITYDGWPLYRFVGDSKPGQTNGQGIRFPTQKSRPSWFVVAPVPRVKFTIDITPVGDGSAWGTVTTSYSYQGKTVKKSCSTPTCSYQIPAGRSVTLHETPVNSLTWPFNGWSAKAGDTSYTKSEPKSDSTLTLHADDGYTVTATYVVGRGYGPASSAKPLVGIRSKKGLGQFLVGRNGLTLYHLLPENTGQIHCTKAQSCLATWPPLILPKGMKAPTGASGLKGKLGVITRKDVGKQVTYDGWPLYYFAGDSKPGQTKGQGFFHVWYVVSSNPQVVFKISITTTGGTTWGAVRFHYKFGGKTYRRACSKVSCAFAVPAGLAVHLRETPTDSTTWPFAGWTIKTAYTNQSQSSSKVKVLTRSNDGRTITATYVVKSGY